MTKKEKEEAMKPRIAPTPPKKKTRADYQAEAADKKAQDAADAEKEFVPTPTGRIDPLEGEPTDSAPLIRALALIRNQTFCLCPHLDPGAKTKTINVELNTSARHSPECPRVIAAVALEDWGYAPSEPIGNPI